ESCLVGEDRELIVDSLDSPEQRTGCFDSRKEFDQTSNLHPRQTKHLLAQLHAPTALLHTCLVAVDIFRGELVDRAVRGNWCSAQGGQLIVRPQPNGYRSLLEPGLVEDRKQLMAIDDIGRVPELLHVRAVLNLSTDDHR